MRPDGTAEVSGELTFATVPAYLQRNGALLASSGELVVDLQGVTRADSAGVALLVEWLRLARAAGRTVRYVNMPPQVDALVRVSGLEKAFALDAGR
jgi:phospholipid transport system transporter-binding protein